MINPTKSATLHERALRVLAGGVSSEFRKATPHPLYFSEGRGALVFDVDGREYLDFSLSQGPLILGHSHPEVLEAVARASAKGQIFAGLHLAELELAERLQALLPCAELLRFGLSGSEADHAALRLARAGTGRSRFVRFEGHYHGWFDNVAVSIAAASAQALGDRRRPYPVPWTKGLPPGALEECIPLPWNDLALVEEALRGGEVAAVITEPVMCNSGCIPPDPGFLEGLRSLCDKHRVVLIFDEVITGFRLGLSGAQGRFGVVPDLAVFGKALANGWPVSVLAGRREFMKPLVDGTVVHAGTLNAAVPGIAAARATVDILERDRVHEKLYHLGGILMDGLRAAAREAGVPVLVQGPGPMFHLSFTARTSARDYRDTLDFDRARNAAFVGAMLGRGIRLIGRGLWYVSAAHTEEHVARAVATAREVFRTLP